MYFDIGMLPLALPLFLIPFLLCYVPSFFSLPSALMAYVCVCVCMCIKIHNSQNQGVIHFFKPLCFLSQKWYYRSLNYVLIILIVNG